LRPAVADEPIENCSEKRDVFLERMYLPAILGDCGITCRTFPQKSHHQYLGNKRPISETYRGQHVLKRDEAGAERCTACGLCAVGLPAEPLQWSLQERQKAKRNCPAKKNTLRLRSICCAAFSAAAKKPAERSDLPDRPYCANGFSATI